MKTSPPPYSLVANRRLVSYEPHPYLARVRERRWCWRCFRWRRFRYRSWTHTPTLDNPFEYGRAWWEDSRGHRR